MRVSINGDEQDIENGISLQQLLDELAMNRGRIAIELNGEIVPRSNFAEQILTAGDRLEIVQAIGGG